MTQNRELFRKDPSTFTIPNDGVTTVEYPKTEEQWAVLQYELSNFVCEGEYRVGLERILSTYLGQLGKHKQPAVWVSGFYGSGKSHFVRMLEHFWRNVQFPDGAEARSLTNLPDDIKDLLRELSTKGQQYGGLWAAAGKLGSGADSIRLDTLRIVLRSAGLPTEYAPARFAIWLKRKEIYDAVVQNVETQDADFFEELRNMYVSPILAKSLLTAFPEFADSQQAAREFLKAQYPQKDEISKDELIDTIDAVLELVSTKPGVRPCTLLILDELQQAIGEDPDRTLQVQVIIEDLSSQFGTRLLVVGTGQSAVQATPQLSKLQGRFTVRVELSDTDVEKVVRQVILRKDQTKVPLLEQALEKASGEIDRHLGSTKIKASMADKEYLVPDYPLLPTRRRFWERVLRAIDTGAAAQLRTQLRTVHEATRAVARQDIGTVVGADFIYEQQKPAMLQSGILLSDLAAIIEEQNDDTPLGKLRSRLCATIFLIGKLPTTGAAATGLRADVDTLADLLVEDLNTGSAALRQQIPQELAKMVEAGTLMQVEDEYRLQTRESAEWEGDYRNRSARIKADTVRINSERDTALRTAVNQASKSIRLLHGVTKVPRKIDLHFGDSIPAADSSDVPVWVQSEWSVTEKSVREEAQRAGTDSPIVFVLLPRLQSDAITEAIASLAAARATLTGRPTQQTTPEGMEAQNAMRTREQMAENKLEELISDVLRNAKVYQGGGNEVAAGSLADSIQQAAENALVRLFPEFRVADKLGWAAVAKKAKEGAGDAFKTIGYPGDIDKHPASIAILDFVGGSGKKGGEVQKKFTGARYGWPKDAVDAILLALLAGGFMRATRNGEAVTVKEIPQSQIGIIQFYREGITVSARQKLKVRSLMQDLGLHVKSGEETSAAPRVLDKLLELAKSASGHPPLPAAPDISHVTHLQALSGNEQLVALHEQKETLLNNYNEWQRLDQLKHKRMSLWQSLKALMKQAASLPIAQQIQIQMDAIAENRTLLADPDPVKPLLDDLTSALRQALQDARQALEEARDKELQALKQTEEWQQLEDEKWKTLFQNHGLGPIPELKIGNDTQLLETLNQKPLSSWRTEVDALPTRIREAREEAAKMLAPQAKHIRPESTTLRTVEEVDNYLDDLRGKIMEHIENGNPVII